MNVRSYATLGLLCSLSTNMCMVARAQAAATAAAAPHALYISILEGEGELNDTRARTAREPIVQVEDENHKPVAGALVLFALQGNSSANANFSGLSRLTVRTDANGQAIGRGFQVTHYTGSFQIQVVATVAALQAEIFIHQSNYSTGKLSRLKEYSKDHPTLTTSVLGAVGFAAAASTILALNQGSATQITVGTGTVGR